MRAQVLLLACGSLGDETHVCQTGVWRGKRFSSSCPLPAQSRSPPPGRAEWPLQPGLLWAGKVKWQKGVLVLQATPFTERKGVVMLQLCVWEDSLSACWSHCKSLSWIWASVVQKWFKFGRENIGNAWCTIHRINYRWRRGEFTGVYSPDLRPKTFKILRAHGFSKLWSSYVFFLPPKM